MEIKLTKLTLEDKRESHTYCDECYKIIEEMEEEDADLRKEGP